MNKQTLHKIIATIAICSVGFLSASVMAGQDESQRQIVQRVMEAKQKLKQAETAKDADRQKLMKKHMEMMHEIIEKMQAMKPRAGMSMQEHEDWINEHQKPMKQVLGQMMEEHQLLLSTCDKSMDMGDMRKYEL